MSPDPAVPAKARTRAAQLRAQIDEHDHRYYVLDSPVIADAEYDALRRELEELEERHPSLITPDSPTQRVGAPPAEAFRPVPHRPALLSLDNGYEEAEIREWHERLLSHLSTEELGGALFAEPKLDGVSLKLFYEDGRLEVAATRGDGSTGEDVTPNARTIRSIPLRLRGDPPAKLDVRGEVILGRKEFDALNADLAERGEKTYANPRNLTSGTLRQLDPAITASRPLEFYAYQLAGAESLGLASHSETLEYLESLGLKTLRDRSARGDLEEVLGYYAKLLARRDEFPVEMDGVVLKVDSLALQRALGTRSRSPRWAIAFKFPARQATTVVEKILVQVGRNGTLTPVAQLRPVALSGVTVSSATLHNRDEIRRLDVREGDTVLIERAGDVIPKVLQVALEKRPKGTRRYYFPEHCPACHSKVVEVEGEVAVRCSNSRCPARLRKQIEHFVSRGGMDVEGVGDKLVDQLVAKGLVRSVDDLYRLDEETLAGLERMAEKSARNVLLELERSRTRSLARLLFALGVPQIGQTVAEAIAHEVQDLDGLRQATQEELERIPGIGPKAAASLLEWLHEDGGLALLARLEEVRVRPAAPERRDTGSGKLAGKTFLFTGTLSNATREEAEGRVRAEGGKVVSGVSKKLSYLVVGDKPGSKLAKAEKLGVEILDENAFEALLAGGGA